MTTEERIDDFFQPFSVVRCLICGWVGDQTILRNRAVSAAGGVEMPRFTSEAHRQNWIEAVRRTKAQKKAARESADTVPAVVEARDVTTAVSPDVELAIELATLDRVIAQLRADLATLERAKEILSR